MTDLKDCGQLKQTWWHIEDSIEPSDGRLVFRVQDFYIKEACFVKNNYIPILLNPYFVGFKARNKNTNQELSFIADFDQEDEENIGAKIKINIGSASDWPRAENSDFRHVKIQYEYIDFWPVFEKRSTWPLGTKIPSEDKNKDYGIILPKSHIDKLKLLFPPGYNGQFMMSGDDSQGEISITVPLGMNIKKSGKNTDIILYKGPIMSETEQILMEYNKPHITFFENKLKYHYIIDEESYEHVLTSINQELLEMNFFISYEVGHNMKFYIVPVFSIIILFLVLSVNWNSGNWFYFTVILLSFATLYLTLRKERFQIPFNKFVLASIIIAIPLLILKPYIWQALNL